MCIYKTDDGKCKKFSDDKITSYCVNAPCEHEKLSNYDKIKSMSVEEITSVILMLSERVKKHPNARITLVKQWLLQEVKK